MKKMFAMLTCLGLCGVMLAGCSRNDDNSGSTSSGVTATTTSKNEVISCTYACGLLSRDIISACGSPFFIVKSYDKTQTMSKVNG